MIIFWEDVLENVIYVLIPLHNSHLDHFAFVPNVYKFQDYYYYYYFNWVYAIYLLFLIYF